MDVEEGTIDGDDDGPAIKSRRRWEVVVRTLSELKGEQGEEKEGVKGRAEKDQETKLLNALDALDPGRTGCPFSRLKASAGLNGNVGAAALERLLAAGVVEEVSEEEKARRKVMKSMRMVRRIPPSKGS